jgi:hypothetical protein
MVVRPFSWMFGGFPNEFTLYIMIENGQLKTLPSTFFLYLVFIIAIAILGAGYQILYLHSYIGKSKDVDLDNKFNPIS